MNVTTAVIFASGSGSRMLPVTSAVQKELLPILNRPVIDYVVSDLIAAGIKHVMFVVQPGSHGLQDYYLGNAVLERQLERLNKRTALQHLRDGQHRAKFSFIEQPEDAGYGTAVPLIVATPYLPKDEAVFVTGGDDFVWHADGTSDAAKFIEAFQSASAAGALVARTAPEDQLFRYGVLAVRQEKERTFLSQIVEKPTPGNAPSNLINVSKYIFGPQVLPYLDKVKPDAQTGELYITDAVQMAAAEHPITVYETGGQFLDAGNTANWLRANLTLAAADPDLRKALEPDVQDLFR